MTVDEDSYKKLSTANPMYNIFKFVGTHDFLLSHEIPSIVLFAKTHHPLVYHGANGFYNDGDKRKDNGKKAQFFGLYDLFRGSDQGCLTLLKVKIIKMRSKQLTFCASEA